MKNIKTGVFSRSMSLAKLGLQAGAKAAEHAVGDLFSNDTVKAIRKKAHLLEQMAILSKELGQLKGSLMKAGQMLSVYGEHFLPPEANQILKTLQSDSPPLEWAEIEKVIVKQIGKEKMALLDIDEEPLAAASLGQVHRARIRSSQEEIVLKVQYPGVDKAIDGDIKTIRRVLSMMDWFPRIPATDKLFDEIRSMLRRELDYTKELEMLDYFRAEIKNSFFVLPKPFPEFCTKRLIAMSYEPGEKVDSVAVLDLPLAKRNQIAAEILKLYFEELFTFRKVQTDPHFGNYRIRPGKDLKIVLYDYGAVREVSADFMQKYRLMLTALFDKDRAAFEIAAGKLGILEKEDPQELKDMFFELCFCIVEPFHEEKPYEWKNNDLPERVTKITWDLFKRFPLRSPPQELVFLDRKMAGIFTFLSVLDVKINARAILAPYLGR